MSNGAAKVLAPTPHEVSNALGAVLAAADKADRKMWADAKVLRDAHGALCRAFGKRTTGTLATGSTGELLDALDAVLAAVDKADRNMWTDTEVLRDAHNTLCRAYRQRAEEPPPAAGGTGGLLEVARGQIDEGMRELDALADLDEQQALTVASARSSLGRATAALAAGQTSKRDIGRPPAARDARGTPVGRPAWT